MHRMFVNTVCVYLLGGPMAKKSLLVPILHVIPHVMIELGSGEVADPPLSIGMMVDSCTALNPVHF